MTNGSLSQKWGKLTQSPKNTWTTYPIVLSQKFSSPTWATAHFFFFHRHAHPSWSQSHGQKWKARVQLLFHLWLKYFLGDLLNSPCKNVLKSENKTKCCFISGSTFHLSWIHPLQGKKKQRSSDTVSHRAVYVWCQGQESPICDRRWLDWTNVWDNLTVPSL